MRKFLKKLFKVIGISVLAGLVVVTISLVALNIIWSRQVKAELARIKAKGEPISMADLAKPAMPDSENGALIYIEIGKRLSTDDARKDMDTLREFTSRQSREKNPKLWDESRAIISKYKDVVALIEAAEAKPRCRFPADKLMSDEEDATPWRYYSQLRRPLAPLLNANAILSAKDGRMEECCRLLDLSFRLTNALEEEPNLISYLCRIVLLQTASRGLQDSLKYGLFDEYQLKRLFDTLCGIDLKEGHRRVLLGERVLLPKDLLSAQGVVVIRKSRVRDWGAMADDIAGKNRKPMDHVLGLMYDLAGRNGDVLVWLRFTNKQIMGLQLGYKQAAAKGMLEDEPHLPFYALCSNMVAGTEGRTSESRFRAMSRIAGDQTLLALIAYKDRYKAYPASLGELRAKLGWEIPVDSFSGKDLIYKRHAKGFILYSIGRNLKDDGGMESPTSDPDRYDMVWRMER